MYKDTGSSMPYPITVELNKVKVPKRTKKLNDVITITEKINITLSDITFNDRMKSKLIIQKEIKLYDNERYWLSIEVRNSKTSERTCKSVSSAYFTLQRLIKLYRDTGLGKVDGEIFGVKSFRE